MVYTNEGCIDTTACFSVNNVGIESQLSSNEVTVYPNPANDYFNIAFSNASEVYSIKLYDMVGKLVIEGKVSNGTETIDVSQLVAGQYTIVISSRNNTISKKIIITD